MFLWLGPHKRLKVRLSWPLLLDVDRSVFYLSLVNPPGLRERNAELLWSLFK